MSAQAEQPSQNLIYKFHSKDALPFLQFPDKEITSHNQQVNKLTYTVLFHLLPTIQHVSVYLIDC